MSNWQILREKIFGRNKRLDRFFYGPEGFPKLSRRYKTVITLVVLVLMVNAWFGGYIHGYSEGTGLPPFVKVQIAEIPPNMEPVTTEQVGEFLDTNDVSGEEYDVGFSCVEFAFLQARNAHWKGVSATVVRITFEGTDVTHLIIGFPTEDEGWLFVEPQSNTEVKPRVGGMWLDQKITGVYYLSEFVWMPIEVEQK